MFIRVAPLILNLSTRWRMSGQLHALATLFLDKQPQVLGEEETV